MAKKNTSKSKAPAPSTPAAKSAAVAKTAPTSRPAVDSPKPTSAATQQALSSAPKQKITSEQIARRAYEIYASGKGGSEAENWHRAERELREGKA